MVNVVLTNPDGKSVTVTNGFTIVVRNLTVTGTSPDAVKTVGGDLVTITGTNFQPGTTVRVDGTQCVCHLREYHGTRVRVARARRWCGTHYRD